MDQSCLDTHTDGTSAGAENTFAGRVCVRFYVYKANHLLPLQYECFIFTIIRRKSNYEARSPEERNKNNNPVLKLQISNKTIILTLNIYSKYTCTFNIQTLRDYGIEQFL